MDGENNGLNPMNKWDDLGGPPLFFGNIHFQRFHHPTRSTWDFSSREFPACNFFSAAATVAAAAAFRSAFFRGGKEALLAPPKRHPSKK